MEYRHLWSHCTPTKQSQKMFSNHVIAIWWTHYNMAEWIPILIDRVKSKKTIGESLMMTSMPMTTCSTATYSSTSSTTTGPANSAMKTLWVWGPYKVCITNQKLQNWYFIRKEHSQVSGVKNFMIFAQLCGALIHTEMTMNFMKMILGRAGLGISIILG